MLSKPHGEPERKKKAFSSAKLTRLARTNVRPDQISHGAQAQIVRGMLAGKLTENVNKLWQPLYFPRDFCLHQTRIRDGNSSLHFRGVSWL